jgi:hypothetical protein
MIRSLTRSFVVTVAAVSVVGCQKEPDPIRAEAPKPKPTVSVSATATGTPSPSESITVAVNDNPPPPKVTKKRKRSSDAGPTYKTPSGPTPSWSDLEAKNPADADGRTIYVDASDVCYVEVPPKKPPSTPLPPGMRFMDRVNVDCPAVFDDAAWDDCNYGPLMKNKTKPECFCMSLGGNPPPPPRLVACPKK